MILKMENEGAVTRSHSDFSIDHILNKAGVSLKNNGPGETCEGGSSEDLNRYSWLQCTRFCPPKVPRIQRRDTPQKRQLGRYPRIPFTNEQIATLEEKFQESPYLSSEEASNLSKKLQLADVKVKIWFQNRRARKRREEMGQKIKEKTPKCENVDALEFKAKPSTSRSSEQNNFEDSSFRRNSFGQSSATVVPFIYVSPQNILEFGHR